LRCASIVAAQGLAGRRPLGVTSPASGRERDPTFG